jgi:hypothetical protein
MIDYEQLYLTLNSSSRTMQVKLIPASQGLVLSIFRTTCLKVSTKPVGEIRSPRRPLSCEATIMTDVAEVKPTVTGIEMKSTSTPFKLQKRFYRASRIIAVKPQAARRQGYMTKFIFSYDNRSKIFELLAEIMHRFKNMK